MTSPENNEELSEVIGRRRPTRACHKQPPIVIDSSSDSEEQSQKPKRKRAKAASDSDDSFHVDTEQEETPAKGKKKAAKPKSVKKEIEKKPRKAVTRTKKTPTKTSRKRVKQEKEENETLPIKEESEDTYNIPAKKIKQELPFLPVKKEAESPLLHVKKEEDNLDYGNSFDVKPVKNEFFYKEPGLESKFKQDSKDFIDPTSKNINSTSYQQTNCDSSSSQDGWTCINPNCHYFNFTWRKQCNKCRALKPLGDCNKAIVQSDCKPANVSNANFVGKGNEPKGGFNSEPFKVSTQYIDPNEDQTSKEYRLVSKRSNFPFWIVKNVINLFNSEATVPFIVRYRSHLTGGLSAEEIRQLKQHHESVKKVIEKAKNMKKKLESLGYLDAALSQAIDSCYAQQELDYLYEPYKVLKSSKLVKVIDLGLSTPADSILHGRGRVSLEQYVKNDLDINEITDLVIYYVGEIMSKDTDVLDKVRELKRTERIFFATKQKAAPANKNKKMPEKGPQKKRPEDVYANYYNFNIPYDRVRPHQILAINRGESEHCLQVTITIPGSFQYKLCQFARNKWFFRGLRYDLREHIFNKALEFLYNKRVSPYLKRLIRSELTKQGEKASLEVFSSNLKYLLLTQPVRNVTVCSIDPGFIHGCKIAILSPQQEVLKTDVLYLNNPQHFGLRDCHFVKYLHEYNVDLLVVGNGKGCRDVEFQISQLISSKWLNKEFKYIVASECGISVYSCSPEAKEEYKDLSPNIISAISLAKRVQDPLCELVKVEPKHLGVGMYQHDINQKKLDSVLDDVVSECVSIVGVDINNAPLRILKKVAGLPESKAKAIIETREKQGSFMSREELKKVKGIGPKTFQQCAGFIKIIPGTCVKKKENSKFNFNYFDQTIIHPEDYHSAKKILEMNKLLPEKIGSAECVSKLKTFRNGENLNAIAQNLDIPLETLNLILDALTSPLDYDIRSTFDKPLFRNKATTINDLVLNSVVSGQVENVTHFGAFVDLGIEHSGLIPYKNMQGRDLHLGQIVKVKITGIDTTRMRISLLLLNDFTKHS